MGLSPAAAQTTDNAAFCDAALAAESAINQEAFDELDTALSQVESTAPPELAATVQALVAQTRAAIETESDPSSDPTFQQNSNTVNEYLYNNCGWQTAEVAMLDYSFDGLPKSFATGPVALKLVNEGAEVHEFIPVRIKSKDKLKKIIRLPEKKADKKIEFFGHEFAGPGAATYMFLDLTKTGRYGALCFIPVGTTDLAALEDEHGGGGKPHALEGMYKEFKVTKA